jgi:release factor glutamine methyltransferase
VKLKQALALAAEKLATLKDIDAPTFEGEVLLRYCLKISRSALHLRLNHELTEEQSRAFFQLVDRRLKGEPSSYIIQKREFYGLDFYVDQRVLIPRPETELLVEETLRLVKSRRVGVIADIGTGSGAIAVSLAVNLFNITNPTAGPPPAILAVDISSEALAVARLNARQHSVENHITFLQGDLLEYLPQPVDILVANLPYVSRAEVQSMPSAQFEPVLALDGGENGLDQIFRLADQLPSKINPGGCVLLEIGMGQGKAVTDYLRRLFPKATIEVLPDLARIERVVNMGIRSQL